MKTEYLLEFGREEEEIIRVIEEDIFLPPIRPPFRQNLRPTSSAEFYEALRELVFPPQKRTRKHTTISESVPTIPQFDGSRIELLKSMRQIHAQLSEASLKNNPISFVNFVQGMSHFDVIRVFLIFLYLISEGKIRILQDQQFGDIVIWVQEPCIEEGITSG